MSELAGFTGRAKSPIGDPDRGTEGQGKTALVTGASSGIGLAMAELLAAKGFAVVLVARREDRLLAIAKELKERWHTDVHPLVADLGSPNAAAEIAETLAAGGLAIDFLVNNAGNNVWGRYDSRPWEDHEQRVRLMGTATLELTHRLSPLMVERGWGRIVNVSSVVALFNASPYDAVYGAVKSMVRSFSEAIDAELRDSGVRCTVSVPGFTATEIFEVAGTANYVVDNRTYSLAMMSPTTVARQAYRAVMSGQPMVVHGVHHRAMAAALLHLPLPMRRLLANKASMAVDRHV